MSSSSTVVSTLKWLVIAGVVVFVMVEMTEFSTSPTGEALQDMFGALGSAMTWLAAHPNLVVGLIFTALLVPLAGVVLGVPMAAAKKYIEEVRKQRESKALAEADPKVAEVVAKKRLSATEKSVSEDADNLGLSDAQAQNAAANATKLEADATVAENNLDDEQKGELNPLDEKVAEGG